jgi:molybdate transport system substrate-binding protein
MDAIGRRLRRLVIASLAGAAAIPALAADVTVFAAASLTDALQSVAQLYREQGGGRVRFSFAATSTLAKQIESGADADVFVSADEPWMDYLQTRKVVDPKTRTSRLGNSLVLVAPIARPVDVDIRPGFDLAGLIGDGRLATGDPAHVPVGRYAMQALTTLGVWPAVERKLARTDNVRAALTLVERGEARFGIVYATDAAASRRVHVAGVFPAGSHAPISYPMAIVAGRARPEVRRFFEFLGGAQAMDAFRRAGFTIR